MLSILSSNAAEPSRTFVAASREAAEDNLQWLIRHLGSAGKGLRKKFATREEGKSRSAAPTFLLLLGSRGHSAFRVRVAQAHLRHDFTPSHWSHAALLGPLAKEIGETVLHEISLEPPHGFGLPTATNALQEGRLRAYADPQRHPNVALLRLPVDAERWQRETTAQEMSILERFQKQRSVLDATELVLHWLSFLWGVGRVGNPLLEGHGIPTTAMIEVVLSAMHYDITPGLESRASCPEAIWQAARWWHPYFSSQRTAALEGVFHVGHKLEV